uniref:Uncharacterized protein n=1 Tax=Rhodnius prolixus TaxID=13249 RepID=T1HRZ2_RHOPR
MSQEHHTSVKKLRQTLRENAFEEWTRCKWQGIGAQHFRDAPKLNKFLFDKRILTGSEWINAIKLNSNYAPLRGVPGAGGQMVGEVGTLCRKCDTVSDASYYNLWQESTRILEDFGDEKLNRTPLHCRRDVQSLS